MASIKLKHVTGNGTILHSPAANPTNDVTLKLPSTTGSAGQVLQVASANHSATNAELEFATAAGAVKQVKKTVVTALESITCDTSGTGSHDSSLAVTITPSSASNLIYVSAFAFGEGNAVGQYLFTTRLKKVISGGSTSYYPTPVGNRLGVFSNTGTSAVNASNSPDSFGIPNFPDTAGTTSAITYTLQFMYSYGTSSAGTYYLNRIVSDSDSTGYPNFVSWITAMEVEP